MPRPRPVLALAVAATGLVPLRPPGTPPRGALYVRAGESLS